MPSTTSRQNNILEVHPSKILMSKQVRAGHYKLGRIEPKRDGPRPSKCGTFGVIKGENIEANGRLEWKHICEGIIKTSRWAAYRCGPGDNGTGTRTDLLESFETKGDAVDWLMRKKGDKFDKTY
jgi:hypothetical protein